MEEVDVMLQFFATLRGAEEVLRFKQMLLVIQFLR